MTNLKFWNSLFLLFITKIPKCIHWNDNKNIQCVKFAKRKISFLVCDYGSGFFHFRNVCCKYYRNKNSKILQAILFFGEKLTEVKIKKIIHMSEIEVKEIKGV